MASSSLAIQRVDPVASPTTAPPYRSTHSDQKGAHQALTLGPAHNTRSMPNPNPGDSSRARSISDSSLSRISAQNLRDTPTTTDETSSSLHAHRQKHNASKLPAFRAAVADRKRERERTSLASVLRNHFPPSPISPRPQYTQDTASQSQTVASKHHHALDESRCIPDSSREGLHHSKSAHNLSDRPESQLPTPQFSRSRSLRFQSAPTSAPTHSRVDPSTASSKSPASPFEPARTAARVHASRSQSSPDTNARPSTGSRLPTSSHTLSTRKSVVLDLPSSPSISKAPVDEEDMADINSSRERALRALEGRNDRDDVSQTTENDTTADLFLNLAKNESILEDSKTEVQPVESSPNTHLRLSHRRPLSAAVPSFPTSPPQVSRRLSADQRDNSRLRQLAESQLAQQRTREPVHRMLNRENSAPASIPTGLERSQSTRSALKPSPMTPRQISFRESFAEPSSGRESAFYRSRRPSLTDSNSQNNTSSKPSPYRSSTLALNQSRAFSASSPLVSQSRNSQKEDAQHNSDTTDSSTSAEPSSVWDELDDLKSRIHRLELTGRMPPPTTSRVSDDRPRTATTNATTMSTSPKQIPSKETREVQPLLLSALNKTKGQVSSEVFSAIESAAMDALALSSMMGAPGQPGPISSAASSIGYSGGVTDRQLRRKADSICRSLTELCLALADEMSRRKSLPVAESLRSPPLTSSTIRTRRPSATEQTPTEVARPFSTLEQRRKSLLNGTSLPNSRYATAPQTPMESSATTTASTAGRKSSLLLSRFRRSEELEEQTSDRASTLLLRSRRTEGEESQDAREGRHTSLLLRSRRAANEDEDARVRAPSRAVTEVNTFRGTSRDLSTTAAQQSSPDAGTATSALSRRSLIPSVLSPRTAPNQEGPPTSLASAASAASPVTPARKLLERPAPLTELPSRRLSERLADRLNERLNSALEERRQLSLGQSGLGSSALLNRSGSLSHRTTTGLSSRLAGEGSIPTSISTSSVHQSPATAYRR